MPLLVLGDANSAPTYKLTSIAERVQNFEHCKLVATATAVGDRHFDERRTCPIRVEVKTALPAAVHAIGMLLDVNHLSREKEVCLTGIECLPVVFGNTIFQGRK